MKIAILTSDNREHFRDYGNPTPYFGTAPEALLQGLAEIGGAEIHVVSCTQQSIPSPEKIAGNIWYYNLHVPKIGWLRTGYQGCIRSVRRKLKEIQPDIVHGQGTERDCALSAVLSGFPNVLTIHGNMRLIAEVNQSPLFSFHGIAARLEAFTIPRSLGVVCITNYTRKAVAGLAKKTWVVPNAVDARFFEVAPEPPQAVPVILCVGNVSRRKNQNNFIRALDALSERKKLKVIFLGSTPDKDIYVHEFFQLIASRPWCEFGGFANREKLKVFLRGATLLALPSLEDNCPMTVLEAMAASVPVVTAKVGGVPDLVEDGRTGLFCDPQDAASISGAVEKILAQPEFGRILATEARRVALERFHPTVIARRHLEIYREVLNTCS